MPGFRPPACGKRHPPSWHGKTARGILDTLNDPPRRAPDFAKRSRPLVGRSGVNAMIQMEAAMKL